MGFEISKDTIEEIRSRCDIVEMAGSYVQLRRAGNHTYKGLCPFHQEKTPSFHVDSVRQTFHCFGCGIGGDVFRFYMEKEHVGFIDAVHMLASQVGVRIPERVNPEDLEAGRVRASERERLFQINEAFAEYFHRMLVDYPESPAATYLRGRGIPLDVAEKFGIGACPDEWTACLNYGHKLGFTDAELVRSGIVRCHEESGRCYDYFKGRLAFAIANEHGKVVGFSCRSLEAKPLNGGKYINTPETPIFKKGNLLYALPLARKAMSERRMAVLCEGQLDTIAFHRAGIECAVAPQGTSFTENQAQLLKRCCDTVYLALDSDAAGQKAVLRDVEILLPLALDIKVVRFPGGKDPDELFAQGGAEALQQAISSAIPWLEAWRDSVPGRYDLGTPAGKGQAADEVAKLLLLVANPVTREAYVQEAAYRLGVSVDALFSVVRQAERLKRRAWLMRSDPGSSTSASGVEVGAPNVLGAPKPGNLPAPPPERASIAMRTLLELALNSEAAARHIADIVPLEDMPVNSPVSEAVNLVVGLALNGEFDQMNAELLDLLRRRPCPDISEVMVQEFTMKEEDIPRAVEETAAELSRQCKENRRKALLQQLRSSDSEEERFELLAQLQAIV